MRLRRVVARAEVQAGVEGVLDDADVVDGLAEDFVQGGAEGFGGGWELTCRCRSWRRSGQAGHPT